MVSEHAPVSPGYSPGVEWLNHRVHISSSTKYCPVALSGTVVPALFPPCRKSCHFSTFSSTLGFSWPFFVRSVCFNLHFHNWAPFCSFTGYSDFFYEWPVQYSLPNFFLFSFPRWFLGGFFFLDIDPLLTGATLLQYEFKICHQLCDFGQITSHLSLPICKIKKWYITHTEVCPEKAQPLLI